MVLDVVRDHLDGWDRVTEGDVAHLMPLPLPGTAPLAKVPSDLAVALAVTDGEELVVADGEESEPEPQAPCRCYDGAPSSVRTCAQTTPPSSIDIETPCPHGVPCGSSIVAF